MYLLHPTLCLVWLQPDYILYGSVLSFSYKYITLAHAQSMIDCKLHSTTHHSRSGLPVMRVPTAFVHVSAINLPCQARPDSTPELQSWASITETLVLYTITTLPSSLPLLSTDRHTPTSLCGNYSIRSFMHSFMPLVLTAGRGIEYIVLSTEVLGRYVCTTYACMYVLDPTRAITLISGLLPGLSVPP